MPNLQVPLTASPGTGNVDFEERVNLGRLREYRIGRAAAALEQSDLGAVLVFDNNTRYLTSTFLGEWTRDKLSRYAILPGPGSSSYGIPVQRHCTTSSTRRG
jgi:Xaa-Pro dipeptidase